MAERDSDKRDVSIEDAVVETGCGRSLTKRLRALNNRWLQLVSYQQEHVVSWAKPDIFQVEPTNHCNLKCPMCPHDLMTRELGFMDLDLYRQAIDQVCDYSASVRLHNMGESLFHKRIDEFVKYARAAGIRTTLSTNASALTRRAGERILDAGLDSLLVSFDGTSKETYEYFRAGARYEQVLAKIEEFLAQRERHANQRTRVTMSLINMPMTRSEIQTFKRRWEKRVDAIRIKPPRNWDGSSERINALVDLSDQRLIDKPCFWLWSSMVILWDGRAVPCCMDYDAKSLLGNIRDKTLAEIFNDSPIRTLRELHVQNRVQASALCRGCSAPTQVSGLMPNLLGRLGMAAYTVLGTRPIQGAG